MAFFAAFGSTGATHAADRIPAAASLARCGCGRDRGSTHTPAPSTDLGGWGNRRRAFGGRSCGTCRPKRTRAGTGRCLRANTHPTGRIAHGQSGETCSSGRRARAATKYGRRVSVGGMRLGWPRGVVTTAGSVRERHDRRPTRAPRHDERLPATGRTRHICRVPASVSARHKRASRCRVRTNELGDEPRTGAHSSRESSHPIPQRPHADHEPGPTAPARLGLAIEEATLGIGASRN
jgi:hypothetical protein